MADHYRQLLASETAYLNGRIAEFSQILQELISSTTTTGDSVDSTVQVNDNSSNGCNPSTAASPEVIESVIGRIRLAIGQSNLFINERFRQFNGLIEDCEAKRGEKAILEEDLAGFWDMIYYQVEDLKKKYADLEELQRSGWVEKAVTAATSAGDLKQSEQPSRKALLPQSVNGGALNGHGKRNGKPMTNGAASNAVNGIKKPAASRSNIREFLKSKRKETAFVSTGQ